MGVHSPSPPPPGEWLGVRAGLVTWRGFTVTVTITGPAQRVGMGTVAPATYVGGRGGAEGPHGVRVRELHHEHLPGSVG